MTTSTDVTRTNTRTLVELADAANDAHRQVGQAMALTLWNAIRAGHALLEAQSQVQGNWDDWRSKNIEAGRAACARYMRLAEYEHLLPDEILNPQPVIARNGQAVYPGIAVAQMYLREIGADRNYRSRNKRHDWEEIRRLRNAGLKVTDIAQLVGTTRQNVNLILMSAEDRKEWHRKRNARYRQRQRALRRGEMELVARELGDDLGVAYSDLRKCLQRLQRAHDKSSNGNVRRSLTTAINRIYQAEDHIGKALRAGSDTIESAGQGADK